MKYWHYHRLYKYESAKTKFIAAVGVFSSAAGGFIFPAYGIILAYIARIYDPDSSITEEERTKIMKEFIIFAALLSFFSWVLGYLQYSCM